jgi:hypothetical protein
VYQAILATCSNVRRSLLPAGLLARGGLLACGALLLACGRLLLACGGQGARSANQAEDGAARPPLARITFTSQKAGSLQLGDRVAIFDRVAFAAPSAIIHDAERDLYWVSNLNGEDSKGGNGFISRLEPTAERSTLNYIDGRRPGVELREPRGLAVFGDVLYVADVKAVRRFKATTGEQLSDIEIPGASFLSDVAIAVDGSLYVADVGSEPSDAAVPDAGKDAIYQVTPSGQVSVVARRPNLGGPFALVATETGLWVTCTGSNELLLLVPSGDGGPVEDAGRLPLPGPAPRGIIALPDGTFVITSESGGSAYRGYRDGPFQPIVSELESPADVGYDARRQRLLIPLLTGHSLAIFDLALLPAPDVRGAKRP